MSAVSSFSISRLFKNPYINPRLMSERTKNYWMFASCCIMTISTLGIIIYDNERINNKRGNSNNKI